MKKILLAIISIILILAYTINPKIDQHQLAIKVKVKESIERKIEKKSAGNPLFLAFGSAFSNAISDTVLTDLSKELVTSQDYYFFSLTQINWQQEIHTVGLGAFGYIYLSPKVDENLDQILEKHIQ